METIYKCCSMHSNESMHACFWTTFQGRSMCVEGGACMRQMIMGFRCIGGREEAYILPERYDLEYKQYYIEGLSYFVVGNSVHKLVFMFVYSLRSAARRRRSIHPSSVRDSIEWFLARELQPRDSFESVVRYVFPVDLAHVP